MRNYQEASEVLGNRDSRRLKYATLLVRRGKDIAVKFHSTDIVTYHEDGSITLDSGGWLTRTTRNRMNEFTPFSISGSLMLGHGGGRRCLDPGDDGWRDWEVRTWNDSAMYKDGMRIPSSGSLQEHKAEISKYMVR